MRAAAISEIDVTGSCISTLESSYISPLHIIQCDIVGFCLCDVGCVEGLVWEG